MGSTFKWQGIDSLLMTLLVSLTIAFTFSEDRPHSIVGHLDWVRMIVMMFLIPLAYLGIQKSNFEEAAIMLQARMKRRELLMENNTRVRVIKICLGLLSEPKVFLAGTGPDNKVIAYDIYGSGIKSPGHGRFPYQRCGIHNVWMKMLVEYGVISALLLIVIWIDAIRRTRWLWKSRGSDRAAKIWGSFLLTFLILYLIIDCGVYESAMSYHVLIPLFAILGYLVTKIQVKVAIRRCAGPAASDRASGGTISGTSVRDSYTHRM